MRRINLINTKAVRIQYHFRYVLEEEVADWLEQHNISNYHLTHIDVFDRLGPFIEFGDSVPDAVVNWFLLRWS